MKKVSVIILQIIWIFCYGQIIDANSDYSNNIAISDLFGAPLIEPPINDVTHEYNTEFTLRCESKVPITWIVPPYTEDAYVSNVLTFDKDRPYGSVITLFNTTVMHVGEYFCVNNDSLHIEDLKELKNNFKAASIYVFIKDPNNLLAHVDDPVITVIQYAEVTIPCKPSSKDVKIELNKDGDESTLFHISYDPRYGFVVFASDIETSGSYSCIANSDTESSTQFHLEVIPSDSQILKPNIDSPTNFHASDGETFTLECTINMRLGAMFSMNWTLPNDNVAVNEGRASFTKVTTKDSISSPMTTGTSILTVRNANSIKDNGKYYCYIYDYFNKSNSNNRLMIILSPGASYIDLHEQNGKYNLNVTTNVRIRWMIDYRGYPPPEFIWTDNHEREISPWPSSIPENDKYIITKTKSTISLQINKIDLNDFGEYKIKAYNGMVEKELKLKLTVRKKPSVIMKSISIKENTEATLECQCLGYPPATIGYTFKPCNVKPSWPNCSNFKPVSHNEISSTILTPVKQLAIIKFTPSEPGIVTCQAVNAEGRDEADAELIIEDLNERLEIRGHDFSYPIAAGDSLSFVCGASAYNFTDKLEWVKDLKPVEENSDIILKSYETTYSYRQSLSFKNIQMKDSGTFECRGINKENVSESKTIVLNVEEPFIPKITKTNLNDNMEERSLGEPVRLECSFIGIPLPKIEWFKDDLLLNFNPNDTRITIHSDNTILDFGFIKEEDHGTYKCVGSSRVGSTSVSGLLKIKNLPTFNYGLFAGVTLAILTLITIIMIYLCYRIKKLKERKASGLNNFVTGCVEQINPALSLDEQADLLPYDKKYEFPRERLKLGTQLGAGAFGIVVKGVAQNLHPYEEETIVAVKTIKQNADNEVLRALISELKIMIHMGQHLNVVNLLGAITKNIDNREVMLIVEYCRFGNVQNFLLKHREFFVDQINPETGEIDHTILSREQREQRWSNDSGYEYNSKGPGHLNSTGYTRHSQLEYFPGGIDSASTEAALITGGKDEGFVMTNNSVQPAWRSNYKMDYIGPARLITTSDLVSWGFQVARGMEYLSSRKVLHGDLAARNILLCDDNVVKICDFGLARSMYKNDNYKKKGESPLPFKWLAIESISDQVFSQYSDVWAFGIVLWELFSLSKVPYPGMNADQILYNKLQNGYRMEKPAYANQEIYDLMLNCWNARPESRPVFTELEIRLGKMLEDGVKDHYIDLNEPYLQMNADMFSDGQKDYLAIMGPPEEIAPAIPNYVNGNIHSTPIDIESASPGYLRMSPKSGNVLYDTQSKNSTSDNVYAQQASPTIISNLDSSPHHKSRKKPEEIPMLKKLNASNSDSDSDASPDPRKIDEKFLNLNSNENPIEYNNVTADNYVNVPSKVFNKQPNAKDAFSNPGYVTIGMKNN